MKIAHLSQISLIFGLWIVRNNADENVVGADAVNNKTRPNEDKNSCLKTNQLDVLCRFNADCCSKLCNTFLLNTSQIPTCVENIPENHFSDSFATLPVRADFKPNKFDGMERWRNKVAVVTGAASGIGFALAKRLCNEGMIVVGTDINDAGVKKTADHCPKSNYHSFTADLRSEQDILNLFAFVLKTVGRVDVLVNNAGVGRRTFFVNTSTEALRTMFDVNVLAPVLCTREALKIMNTNNITSGYIMFTNSVHGSTIWHSQKNDPTSVYFYEATKHALIVLREGLRRELRARGSNIRVGEVSPAAVATNAEDGFVPRDDTDKERAKKITKGDAVAKKANSLSPDDIAEAFVYMLQAPERMDINTILIENNSPR